MEYKAIKFIKQKYCADPNDKQGFINGNFWIGIADFMTDFSAHENATLIEQNQKLRNELQGLIRVINQPSLRPKNEGEWMNLRGAIFQTLKDTENGK